MPTRAMLKGNRFLAGKRKNEKKEKEAVRLPSSSDIMASMELLYGYTEPENLAKNQAFINADTGYIYIQDSLDGALRRINFTPDEGEEAAEGKVLFAETEDGLNDLERSNDKLYIVKDPAAAWYWNGSEFRKLEFRVTAQTVNGHTVDADVPADAKFTDTKYNIATEHAAGLMSPGMVLRLASMVSKSDLQNSLGNMQTREDAKSALAMKANAGEVYSREETKDKIEDAVNALIWKNPVEDLKQLQEAYPEPDKGTAAYVRSDSNIYLFNGTEWKNITKEVILPGPATQETEGLLSAEDKQLLDAIPQIYATKEQLENIKIPDTSSFAVATVVEAQIKNAVYGLATQRSVNDLKEQVQGIYVPDSYTKMESDNRYAKKDSLPDLSPYALTSSLSGFLKKEDISPYALKQDFNAYEKKEDLNILLGNYLKQSDTDALYADKAPQGHHYVTDNEIEGFASSNTLEELQKKVTTLVSQVNTLLQKEDHYEVVIGYAVVSKTGQLQDRFLSVQEFKNQLNFVFRPNFTEEEKKEDIYVALFSNLPRVAAYNDAVLQTASETTGFAALKTKVTGPYYILTQPMPVTAVLTTKYFSAT